jgi:hypothetical protein
MSVHVRQSTANQLLFEQPQYGTPQMSYVTGSRGRTAPLLTDEQARKGLTPLQRRAAVHPAAKVFKAREVKCRG